MMTQLKIAGWQKVSLIDYPGRLASVLFLAGCNMRCHYCHNRHIWDASQNKISFNTVLAALRQRRYWIDAVVVSGGEPTVYPELVTLLRALKDLGVQVKLDTNGTRPLVIKRLISMGLVDYLALDLKAPDAKHIAITGLPGDTVLQSLQYLRQQKKIPFVVRTTLSPRLTLSDLVEMAKTLINDVPLWQIQQCRCPGAYSTSEVLEMVKVLQKYVPNVVVKNL